MTRVVIYSSPVAYTALVVRKRRKHGRPKGRGKKVWTIRYIERLNPDGFTAQ